MYISLLLSYNIYWMKYIKEKNKVPVFGVLFNGSYVICSGLLCLFDHERRSLCGGLMWTIQSQGMQKNKTCSVVCLM